HQTLVELFPTPAYAMRLSRLQFCEPRAIPWTGGARPAPPAQWTPQDQVAFDRDAEIAEKLLVAAIEDASATVERLTPQAVPPKARRRSGIAHVRMSFSNWAFLSGRLVAEECVRSISETWNYRAIFWESCMSISMEIGKQSWLGNCAPQVTRLI